MKLRNKRNYLYAAALLLVILLVYNILSSVPDATDMSVDSPLIIESHRETDKLRQHIERLTAERTQNLNEISSLKETIQDLQSKLQDTGHHHEPNGGDTQQHLHEAAPDARLEEVERIEIDTSASFELVPEHEIVYPAITISNSHISDTPNTANAQIRKDIHHHNVIYEADTGVIHGNPLLLDQCMNVLTVDHEVNILSSISYYHNGFVPWLWSRESIGSVLQNQKFNLASTVLASDTFDNETHAIYVQIDNSAAKIMQHTLLKSHSTLQALQMKPNTRVKSKCAFSFVQHPITRFIAAYFEMNVFLWQRVDQMEQFPAMIEQVTFYKIKNNLKARLKAFIQDLRKLHYIFVKLFGFMNVLSTQSGQLSFAQIDIDHVFKYEYIEQEYLNILTDPNDQFCIDESDHFVFDENVDDEQWDALLFHYGVQKEWLLDKEFREWMGLKVTLDDEHQFGDIEDLQRMDILYIYDAMDYELYSKVVEYYWQDFVCFDYRADYKHDVLDYLDKYQTKYPGFPVINRTETNWDKILAYYYSKHKN